jgi:hypothetical protein
MADASTKVVATTAIAHVSSGASIAAAAFSASTFDTALTSTNCKAWPRCDVILEYFPGSTTASTLLTIPLFRRDINIDGTSDEAVPSTIGQAHYCGSFQLSASTSTGSHYMNINDVPLTGNTDCEFYISNALTNTIPAGWKLIVVPKTDVGATT